MAKHRGIFRSRHKVGRKSVYAKRDRRGRFADIQSIKRTLRGDRRSRSKTIVKPGYGFRGDLKRRKKA